MTKLERIVRLRRMAQEKAASEFATCTHAVTAQRRKIDGLRAERTRLAQVQREICRNTVDVRHLKLIVRQTEAIDKQVAGEERELAELALHAESCRASLEVAFRKRQGIEKFAARREARRQEALARRADEVVLRQKIA